MEEESHMDAPFSPAGGVAFKGSPSPNPFNERRSQLEEPCLNSNSDARLDSEFPTLHRMPEQDERRLEASRGTENQDPVHSFLQGNYTALSPERGNSITRRLLERWHPNSSLSLERGNSNSPLSSERGNPNSLLSDSGKSINRRLLELASRISSDRDNRNSSLSPERESPSSPLPPEQGNTNSNLSLERESLNSPLSSDDRRLEEALRGTYSEDSVNAFLQGKYTVLSPIKGNPVSHRLLGRWNSTSNSPLASGRLNPNSPLSSDRENRNSPLSPEPESPKSPFSLERGNPDSHLALERGSPNSLLSSERGNRMSRFSREQRNSSSPFSSEYGNPKSPFSPGQRNPSSLIRPERGNSNSPFSSELRNSNSPFSQGQRNPNSPLSPERANPNSPFSTGQRNPNSPFSHGQRNPNSPFSHGQRNPNSPFSHGQRSPNSPLLPEQESPNSPLSTERMNPNSPYSLDRGNPHSPFAPEQESLNSPVSFERVNPNSPFPPERESPNSPDSLERGNPNSPFSPERESLNSPLVTERVNLNSLDSPERGNQNSPFAPERESSNSPFSSERGNPNSPFSPEQEIPNSPLSSEREFPISPLSPERGDPNSRLSPALENPNSVDAQNHQNPIPENEPEESGDRIVEDPDADDIEYPNVRSVHDPRSPSLENTHEVRDPELLERGSSSAQDQEDANSDIIIEDDTYPSRSSSPEIEVLEVLKSATRFTVDLTGDDDDEPMDTDAPVVCDTVRPERRPSPAPLLDISNDDNPRPSSSRTGQEGGPAVPSCFAQSSLPSYTNSLVNSGGPYLHQQVTGEFNYDGHWKKAIIKQEENDTLSMMLDLESYANPNRTPNDTLSYANPNRTPNDTLSMMMELESYVTQSRSSQHASSSLENNSYANQSQNDLSKFTSVPGSSSTSSSTDYLSGNARSSANRTAQSGNPLFDSPLDMSVASGRVPKKEPVGLNPYGASSTTLPFMDSANQSTSGLQLDGVAYDIIDLALKKTGLCSSDFKAPITSHPNSAFQAVTPSTSSPVVSDPMEFLNRPSGPPTTISGTGNMWSEPHHSTASTNSHSGGASGNQSLNSQFASNVGSSANTPLSADGPLQNFLAILSSGAASSNTISIGSSSRVSQNNLGIASNIAQSFMAEPFTASASSSQRGSSSIAGLAGHSRDPQQISHNVMPSPYIPTYMSNTPAEQSSSYTSPVQPSTNTVIASSSTVIVSSGGGQGETSSSERNCASSSSAAIDNPPSPGEPTFSCNICLDSVKTIQSSSRNLCSTVCGHVFCSACLHAALKRKRECPMCRRKLGRKQYHPLFL